MRSRAEADAVGGETLEFTPVHGRDEQPFVGTVEHERLFAGLVDERDGNLAAHGHDQFPAGSVRMETTSLCCGNIINPKNAFNLERQSFEAVFHEAQAAAAIVSHRQREQTLVVQFFSVIF